ncbi:MAG: hypothetical protein JXA81_00810 [Sedimentisphaerales bacterium]|nr:hypothetical protein [Sedimentisphaerales bacterium]
MFRRLICLFFMLAFCLVSSAHAATIIWVSDSYDDNVDGEPDDQPWVDMLEANGYTVDLSFRNQEGRTLDDNKIAALNAADLIIISRNSDSGNYASDATEVTRWNSITAPLILQAMHFSRNSRWLWVNTTTLPNYSDSAINIIKAGHPIFAGVQNGAQITDGNVGPSTFVDISDLGNGTLLATVEGTGEAWITEWETGVEFYPGAGQFAGGPRLMLCSGTQETNPTIGRGEYNLTPEGEKLFLNAVRYMLGGAIEKAHGPEPRDGSLHVDTSATLTWSPGDFAVSHDLYFGEVFEDVNNGAAGTFLGNLTATVTIVGFPGFPYSDPLVPGTTYYWRVDEVNESDPNSPWKGDVWSFSIPSKTAYNPVPSLGAELVPVTATLSWTAGLGAKVHYVIFGEEFDEVNNATMGKATGTVNYSPGRLKLAKTYYWRVDEFDGFNTYKGQVWSFTTEGSVSSPSPANGAQGVSATSILAWKAGAIAASHEVYFGTDADAVKNATKASPEYKGPKALGDESYNPGQLMLQTTYYWRIEEVNGVNPDSPWPGNVWSFTTGDYFVLDDFETYDANDNQIWYSWHDGLGYGMQGVPPFFAGNGTGAAVGDETTASYTEETIVNSGLQSMPLLYDNNKQGFSKYSEAEYTLSSLRNWTAEDVAELSIWFRGNPASVGSFVESPVGTYTVTGSGADIWSTADQFHYAFKTLTGAGSIIARVISVDNTDPWAKAGVMIRETLEPGSKFAAVYITPGQGCRFQDRTDTGIAATSDTSVATAEQIAITAPYWIQIERDFAGNFRCYYSANGSNWQQMSWGVQNIPMNSSVYVGLAVTAHSAGATCQAQFSNVTITGNVSGQWASQDIGIASNDTEPLYVAVFNSTGAPAIITHTNPDASTIDTWTEWIIPLQDIADQGINLTDIDKIAIGLGTRGNTTVPGGSGKMYFDNIRLYRPREAAAE